MGLRILERARAVAATTALLAAPLHAQSTAAAPCRAAFDQFALDVARNYAGFTDKVPTARRPAYDRLVRAQRARAAQAHTPAECLEDVFGPWVRFFRDGHLGVGLAGVEQAGGGSDPEDVRARYAGWPRRDVTEDSARRVTDALAGRDGLVGIWDAVGAPYRFAMIPVEDSAGRYDAVLLRADSVYWMPGQVKAIVRRDPDGRYATRFYMRDHSPLEFIADLQHGVLRGPQGILYVRRYPEPTDTEFATRFLASQNLRFAVRALSASTVLVQLPSFDASVTAQVDSVARIARELLRDHPNLLIDVRGNGGGLDRNYAWLLPLLYTKPWVEVSAAFYATPDNIARYAAFAARPDVAAVDRRTITALVTQMQPFRGRFMPRESFTYRQDSVYTSPGRVAVLVDEGCASSCEQFVLAARESDKVTSYGTRTAGILDYSNVMTLVSNDGRFQLRYPTSRSQRLPSAPVDPGGIPAHVPIPAGEAFAVEWVHRQLEERGRGRRP